MDVPNPQERLSVLNYRGGGAMKSIHHVVNIRQSLDWKISVFKEHSNLPLCRKVFQLQRLDGLLACISNFCAAVIADGYSLSWRLYKEYKCRHYSKPSFLAHLDFSFGESVWLLDCIRYDCRLSPSISFAAPSAL